MIDAAPPAWLSLPPGVDTEHLFEREATGLKAFAIATADGRYTAQVDALEPPRFEVQGDKVELELHLAPGESLDCSLHAQRILPAHRLFAVVSALRSDLDLRGVGLVQVSVAGGHPLTVLDAVYVTRAGLSPQLGEYKYAVLSHPTLSVLCTQDKVGYRDSFLRAVRQLVVTLVDHAGKPPAPATWSEVKVAYLGSRLAGWQAARALAPDAQGVRRDVGLSALLFPAGDPAVVTARDLLKTEVRGPDGALRSGGYSVWRDTVLTDFALQPDGEGAFKVEGTEAHRPLQGRVAPRERLRAPAAADLLALLEGRVSEIRYEAYSALRPLEVLPALLRRDPAGARGVTLQVGSEPLLAATVDMQGAFESELTEISGAQLTLRRIWSEGTPP